MTHDRDHSAAAASKRYRALIDEFCRADYTPEQLLQRIAPRAVKAGGRPLPPGTQYYIENDVVTTVYLDDPLVQVVWWRRPEEGATEVGELHIVPQLKVVEYKAFVAEHGLGAGKALPQGHALANIPHEHAYRCGARALVLTVEEIVWKGEVVGKIGGIGMRKTARPPAGSERR